LVGVLLIVAVVLLVLAGLSQNFSTGIRTGPTLRWIVEVWSLYADTIFLSLGIALACLAVTLVLGVPIAYALARKPGRATRLIEELLVLPVAVPGLATALALILF